DFADLTAELVALVPPGRRLVFLEGGYDLEALRDSTAAALAALAGERLHTEAPTGGGPGRDVVTAAQMVHRRAVQEGASQPGGPPTIAPRWGLQDGDPLCGPVPCRARRRGWRAGGAATRTARSRRCVTTLRPRDPRAVEADPGRRPAARRTVRGGGPRRLPGRRHRPGPRPGSGDARGRPR